MQTEQTIDGYSGVTVVADAYVISREQTLREHVLWLHADELDAFRRDIILGIET